VALRHPRRPRSEFSPDADQPYYPGATLATIDSPVLVDGAVNEFRFLDPATGLVPLSVPIAAGARFFVDLELGSDPSGSNAPGILMDTDDEELWELGFRNLGNSPSNPDFWFSIPVAIINGGDSESGQSFNRYPSRGRCGWERSA
jgi:hypothetical protein